MESLDAVARTGKALSDRTRLRILAALAIRPLCVCELTDLLGTGQPSVSRHLGILRAAGLVEDRREGRWVRYRLGEGPERRAARGFLAGLEGALAADPALGRLRRRSWKSPRGAPRRPPVPAHGSG